MGIDVVELIARTLVEHIGIDPVRLQQRDTVLDVGTVALQARQLRRQGDDFLVELLPRIEPVAAGIGVDAEITDHRRRYCIKGKPGKHGFEAIARDHGRSMRRPG